MEGVRTPNPPSGYATEANNHDCDDDGDDNNESLKKRFTHAAAVTATIIIIYLGYLHSFSGKIRPIKHTHPSHCACVVELLTYDCVLIVRNYSSSARHGR